MSRATRRAEGLPASLAWALGSGTILQGLNSAMIAVAIVSISTDFGDPGAMAWVISGLYLSAAVASPTGGRLGDLFGPRRVYVVGLAITLVASIAGPFVPSAGWLIADRILLGIGTALQFPAAMAIIRSQARDRGANASSALAVVALCGQTTAALGPGVGGLVVAIWGWQGIFWINLPLVANAAFWVLRIVPKDAPRERAPASRWRAVIDLDPLGLVLFVATLVFLMLGLLSLDRGVEPWWFAAALAAGVVLALWSLRVPRPFLDVRLLARSPALLRTCGRALVTFVSFYAIFYGMPQWLESVYGLRPDQAGLLMLPIFGVGALSTFAAGRLGARIDPRLLLIIGALVMVAAGALAIWGVTAQSPLWVLIVLGALLGLPNGFNNLGNQLILHSAVPGSHAGVASGLYRTSQYIGASLAAVVVTSALGQPGAAPAPGGLSMLGYWIGGIGAVLVVLSLIAKLRRSDA